MSSSPKITLELYPRSIARDPQSSSDVLSTQGAGPGLDSDLSSLSLKSEPSWVCAICYHSNQGGFIKCAVCGVRKPAQSADTPTAPTPDPFLLNSSTQMNDSSNNRQPLDTSSYAMVSGNQTEPPALDQPGIACPACTFHNDPFMIQCEICGTELQDAQSKAFMLHRQEQHQRSISQLPSSIDQVGPSPVSQTPPLEPGATTKPSSGNNRFLLSVSGLYPGGSSKQSDDANSVKLSFRAGGMWNFHTLLKAALAARAWEVMGKKKTGSMVLWCLSHMGHQVT